MRVLVFRHAAHEDLGHVRPVLESHGITVQPVDLYSGAAPPHVESGSGLIFMGGTMSVNDGLPWLDMEMKLIRAAVERGTPVLGVCLGAQLIAKALGATVRRAAEEEIGWFEVQLTQGADADPLFAGLRSPCLSFSGIGRPSTCSTEPLCSRRRTGALTRRSGFATRLTVSSSIQVILR